MKYGVHFKEDSEAFNKIICKNMVLQVKNNFFITVRRTNLYWYRTQNPMVKTYLVILCYIQQYFSIDSFFLAFNVNRYSLTASVVANFVIWFMSNSVHKIHVQSFPSHIKSQFQRIIMMDNIYFGKWERLEPKLGYKKRCLTQSLRMVLKQRCQTQITKYNKS
jgi:hypothetical protein